MLQTHGNPRPTIQDSQLMRRLPLSLLLVIVIAIFGVGYILDAVFERYGQKSSESVAQITIFGQEFAEMLNGIEFPMDVIAQWPKSQIYRVNIKDKFELPLPDSLQAAFESGEPLLLESEQSLSAYYYLPRHGNVLSIQSNQLPGAGESGLASVFTGMFYVGTLGLVLLWLKPLLNRLRLLRNSAKAFGSGNLDSRVNVQGLTYIHEIEMDFNRMADQIQQLIEDNKLLTSAVSHDLRTPLARLRFGVDTLKEKSSTTANDKYLIRINNDLNEMESLVDSLLQFARLDNIMSGMEKTEVSLRDLLSECSAQFYDDDISITIKNDLLDAKDTLEIPGCIEHLATLFNNLLQNALKYAKHAVIIEMRRDDDAIVIAIKDDGPGVPSEQRKLLMKPFERGGGATGKGYGLGLAVALRIAQHHGGAVTISRCSDLGGAKLTVTLKI